MAENLYVTSTESKSGKSVISMGLMEMLLRNVKKVAFFRPLININNDPKQKDHDINLISSYYKLDIPYEDMYAFTTAEANDLISTGKYEYLLEGIVSKYKNLENKYDFVLCEGTDFEGSTSAFEFDINADIANNIASPVLLVASGYNRSSEETLGAIELSLESLSDKGSNVVGTIINRADNGEEIRSELRKNKLAESQLIYYLPNLKTLASPTIKEIADGLNAKVLYGWNRLNRHVESLGVAAMQLRNVLNRITEGALVITPGDRADVISACLLALNSSSMPKISGLMLTGGLLPEDSVINLIDGIADSIPILSVPDNTFEAAVKASHIQTVIDPEDTQKINQALSLFEKNINIPELREKIIQTKVTIITPKMFEYRLIQKARAQKQHIVLPEGEEDRILRASEILRRRDIVDITLIGREKKIRGKISSLGLNFNSINIIEIQNSKNYEDYANTYFELRKHKGLTMSNALDNMTDPNYYGSMMVYKGHADGMVSGSITTTRNTLRPAFEFIKTKKGFSIISSIFFMCLEDRVLVYGDCAVNPDPNAQQLAEIAISSAHTAKAFGIEPRVAMLSYSTGESGVGDDVEKVKEATKISKKMSEKIFPGLLIEGPLQYDAAVDPGVAKTKMPKSEVAGRATVYIFPDLNTGNNTYKAVQRSAGAVAIGPVIQGLNKPVNDLSRGCTITDIVNTIAITAIQAQSEKNQD